MITVVLADDHQLFREGLRRMLEREPDLQVLGEAATGQAALALTLECQPDILLLDVSMPDHQAAEICGQLVADGRTRVVVVSGLGHVDSMRAMFAAGASAYVTKDSASTELLAAIREVAAGERFASAALRKELLDDYHALLRRGGAGEHGALSTRQRELLRLLAEGKSTKQVAAALHLSVRTVETYRGQLMEETGCRSMAELTKYAVRAGLTGIDS